MYGGLIQAPDYGWADLLDPVIEHPLNDGLVLWLLSLPGLDGGRQWFDLKGLNHGTLTNMTTVGTSGWGRTVRPGGYGELRFDGSNDYVATPVVPLPAGLTLSAWVLTSSADATAGYAGNAALNVFGRTGGTTWVGFGVHGGNVRYTHGGTPRLTGSVVVNDGAWHHIAATHAPGGAVAVYVDGEPDGTASATYSDVYSSVDVIGCGYGIGDLFDGRLDDLRVHNRALSAAEVRGLYDASRLGYPRQLRRVSPVVYSLPSPVAETPPSTYLFNPAWARQSNLILGGGVHV